MFKQIYCLLILLSIIILNACNNQSNLSPEKYILNFEENYSDTLFLDKENKGTYHHYGIGVTFDIKYNVNHENVLVQIQDFEYQYKPSKKVTAAEFKFTKSGNDLKLNSISYPHKHYQGEFGYLESKMHSSKFIKL